MPEPAGTLHGCLGLSTVAHGTITKMDLSAVRSAPGVVDVLTAKDVPGENDISPTGRHDEPVLADGKVQFYGQPIFCVIAETREQARRASRLAKVEYEELPSIIDIGELDPAKGKLVTPPLTLKRGDAAAAIAKAPRRLKGQMRVGGQEHFYLEGHIAMAMPGEDDDVTVYSSTQHPSEVQHMVAHALGVPSNAVTVEIRRMGGGFGGKETQGNQFAALAAIAAKKHHRAVKIRPDRDDDMTATGKRHDFLVDYEVGFDDDGNILGVDYIFAARCGFSSDLSGPVTDRALFHCDNAYFCPAVHAQSAPLYTNTVSNTAFRGFGGPQGMVGAERVIDEVAFAVGKDPLEIRKLNFYGTTDRNVTPYHQTVEDNIIHRIVAELEESADYARRRRAIAAFNANSRFIKRGLALTPVKFGISFTATHYNQAGALVHVYTDGSVHLNHGGTEMGQGLYVKVAQVVAEEFQIDLDQVKITATTTAKVPNTSATAASSGSDLNGMAAQNAARQIKRPADRFRRRKISGAARPDRVPAEPGAHRQPGDRLRRPGQAGLYGAHPAVGGRLLQDAENPLGPRQGRGPAVLLFRLWRVLLGSFDRHADRRIYGRAHRHPARDRPLAEPRHRSRPDRGRLHPGHGLADDRGTVVGRQGPAAHACAVDLQDPARLRPAEDLQRDAGRLAGSPASRRCIAPRRSASRPSCSACRCCMRCRMRWRASPTTRSARASTRRRRPSAC